MGPGAARVVYGVKGCVSAVRGNRATQTDFADHTFGRVTRGDADVSGRIGTALRISEEHRTTRWVTAAVRRR